MMEENQENVDTTVNEENVKNNKGLIIGIVIAAVIVILAVGFFVFGKAISVKNLTGYYDPQRNEFSSG